MNRFIAGRALRRLTALACAIAGFASPAHAYRPFDGTDAAVAEEGVFELEAGAGRTRIGDVDDIAIPQAVFNFGLPYDTEFVIEGQFDRELGGHIDGSRNTLGDTQFSFKHVFRKGSLQDGGSGLSVAGECAVLLPEVHGSHGSGADCAAIVSNKWDALALHLNAAIGRTREHDTARTLSLIAEGPDRWAVRPVTELLAERDTGGARLNSVLVGAIWQRSDTLAFDLAFRHAHTDELSFNEVRLGLTWSLPFNK
jgi:hypothetical protein